jgi:hypothetical protein
MSRGKNIRSWLALAAELLAESLAEGDVCALPRAATSTGTARIHANFFILPPELSLSEIVILKIPGARCCETIRP